MCSGSIYKQLQKFSQTAFQTLQSWLLSNISPYPSEISLISVRFNALSYKQSIYCRVGTQGKTNVLWVEGLTHHELTNNIIYLWVYSALDTPDYLF